MKKIIVSIVILTFFSSVIFSRTEMNKKASIKRFVLAVGANYGGSKREKLRYAVSDAKAFLNILTDMGGVDYYDAKLLEEPDTKELKKTLEALKEKVNEAKQSHRKTEVIFYYSGHSDEQGLMLAEEKFLYEELRNEITSLPADVKVAVLDSCSSGALIREKGGQMTSSFLLDSSYDMKGYAFITSSSEDEASQESDKIKSSFFTHYMLSGLRGAADMTGDGRVSLNEAYQYAYNETLGRTQKTMSGPQHAGYYIKMSGTGDVIITEVQKSTARLEIEEGLEGKFFIRNNDSTLVAELQKKPDQKIQLGVDAGEYTVINQRGHDVYEASMSIETGSSVSLAPGSFIKSQREFTFSRGDNLTGYHVIPLNTQFFPTFLEYYETAVCKITISFFGSYCGRLEGFSTGIGIDIVETDVKGGQYNVIGNIVKGKTNGLQGAAILNLNGGDFKGVQGAGTFNVSGGNFEGVQGAGLFSINKQSFKGVQGDGLFDINGGDFKGVQGAGLFSLNGENFRGIQGDGLFAINGHNFEGVQGASLFALNGNNFKGVQGTALFAINGNNFEGVQGTALFNINGSDFKGIQGSALFNVNKGNFQGLQGSALFNYTKENQGLQTAILNYANSADGLALGLINLTAKDGADVLFWADNQSVVNLGLKFNYNYIYSIIYQGLLYNLDDSTGIGAGYLFGFHLPIFRFFIDADMGFFATFAKTDLIVLPAAFIYNRNENISGYRPQARLNLGVKLFWGFSVYAGVGVNGKTKSEFKNMVLYLPKTSRDDINTLFFLGAGYNFNW
ncbi:MAG: caspase family protein [Spirochaetia bacterium]|nr:caspase family protein [Spirochaetia bacterium]